MECIKIKELLSEYIDGTLDEQRKALVEGHLATCKACSKELVSLKAYAKQMASLKRTEAPEDFLKSVHERIERRFQFEKIVRALFFPARIKIPLEVTAIAATVVLAIFVFKVVEPTKGIIHAPLAPESVITAEKPAEITAEKPKEEPIKIARKEKLTKPAVVLEEEPPVIEADVAVPAPAKEAREVEEVITPPPIPIKEEKPIELALLIEPEVPVRPPGFTEALKALSDLGAPPERRRVTTMSMKEELARKAPPVTQQTRLADILTKVKDLVNTLEGKVISVEYEKETNIPQYITAEIPSRHYETFLQKLAQYGSVQGPPEEVELITAEPVSVKIKFAYSK